MTRPLARPLAQNGKNHGNLRRVASLALLTTAISSLACEQATADSALNWTGSADNSWFNAGNWEWDTGAVPTASREARINKTGVIISGWDAAANNLLIGLSTTSDLTIRTRLATTTATLGYNNGSTGSVFLSGAGVRWQNSGALTVGNAGAGIISLGYLASMEAGTTYLGGAAGGSGSLEISGGATFTSSADLYVGYGGAGSLTVTSGTLQNVNGNLADGLGSTGTATITGPSSSWINSGALRVGGGGVGTLTVSDGGTVTSGSGVIGHLTSANGSSVVVTGTGSTWNSSGSIIVGNIGASELDVLSGGTVTSSGAMIGRHSTSTAKVNGAGSSWNTGNLYIGGDDTDSTTPRGNGTLIVSGGGSVTSSGVRLGLNSGDSGTASISGSGSVWNTGGANTVLSVGFNGTGTVTVSDNARLETAWAIIGHNASSTGSVTISNGARLTDTGSLYVGNEGTGTLTVASGGDVTSTDGFVGTGNGSHGTATVTGSGSSWNMAGALFVGQNTGSTGTMTISDGATVTDVQGIVGDLAGSTGSLTVNGAGSTWTSVVTSQEFSGDVNAGRLGNGTITVSNGGKITGNRFYAGNNAGSSGTVLITGTGSSITTTDRFVVGSNGTGTATVTNGGTISTGIIKIASQAGSTGTLNVGAAHGAAAAAAGALDTKAIAFGAGTGVLEFNFTDPSYVVSAAISGAGKVRLDAGNLTLSGINTYTQGTEVNGGTLNVTGSLSGSATEVTLSGAQLANSGSISGSNYGVRLATSGNTVTNSGNISGGTASVFFGADRNTLNILPTATFDGLVDYNNTIGNTTSFGAGSYRIAASKYLDAANTIALNNASQTVILDRANTSSGYINVVSIPSASQAATQYTSSVSDVVGSILGLDVARPDQITIGETTISALQYGEEKPETKEAKALRMLGDNAAVDGYGNLFWARVFGGLRYQPSNDGDFSSHTSHYGLISGVDHQFENHRLGFFAGGGSVRSVAGDGASIMTGNTGFLGLYGAIELDGFKWNASITGGGIDNEASRTINNGAETASGDFMGWYVSPELSVSRGYQIAPRWQLTPSVKARYTGAFYDGYDEKGSSQNVSFDARQTHSLDGRLQVELQHQVALPSGLPATVTATAALGDTQYLGSGRVRANLDNNEFTVSSSADKNVVGASLGVGFDAMVSERTAVYGGIDGTLYSDKSMAASGRLGLKLAF